MFDLNYYDTRRKLHQYFQNDKNKGMSRQHTHEIIKDCKGYKNPKNVVENKLKMMPESKIKNLLLELYNIKGEEALVKSGLFKC